MAPGFSIKKSQFLTYELDAQLLQNTQFIGTTPVVFATRLPQFDHALAKSKIPRHRAPGDSVVE